MFGDCVRASGIALASVAAAVFLGWVWRGGLGLQLHKLQVNCTPSAATILSHAAHYRVLSFFVFCSLVAFEPVLFHLLKHITFGNRSLGFGLCFGFL